MTGVCPLGDGQIEDGQNHEDYRESDRELKQRLFDPAPSTELCLATAE